jgi:fatty acid synthase
MSIFLKNISFHGILLDALFEEDNQDWLEVSQLLTQGIQSGAVRPLKSTIFDNTQVEQAFRFMAQGKHIGKVLLQVHVLITIHCLDLKELTPLYLVLI